jgi:ATP-binding cassette subfamily B protein
VEVKDSQVKTFENLKREMSPEEHARWRIDYWIAKRKENFIITLLSNVAVLVVLWFGGKGVIEGSMTLGQMTAFFSYTSAFVYPFFILSFASTFVSRAQVSLGRINEVLDATDPYAMRAVSTDADSRVSNVALTAIVGHIVFKNVTLRYGEKTILKSVSFEIQPHTRTAIIGPTGAGKTELFYLMAGLATPTEGEIFIDGKLIGDWDSSALLSRIGMVFQDSIIFNTSLRENVLFKGGADEAHLATALESAELSGLVKDLPEGLETNVSERGTTLSGGQKQRLMLARALAINPSILLLDDFTARVDAGTEGRILKNIRDSFKDITLISITQKVEPVKDYDHIIVLMEGELIAEGKHDELLAASLEYRQIYESQMSTEQH